jgi:hypothetical protein
MIKKIDPPYIYYIWLLLSLAFFTYSIFYADNFVGKIIIPIITSSIVFFYFLNYSCFIKVFKSEIIIYYLPFKYKRTISTINIHHIAYTKGFYDLINNENPKNRFLPRICYDYIQIHYKSGVKMEIRVNVRTGQFKDLLEYFNHMIRYETYN